MLKFLLKSAFWALEASYNTPERKGARGERRVHSALTSVLNEKDYQVLSDLTLPVAGGTTQIDHLLISRYGIFVIETKNMSGWIFGSSDQRNWTQVLKGGKRRSFQNPLRQNYAHVKAVQVILGIEQSLLYNFVVFTGSAQPKTAMPENVAWGLQDLGRLIAIEKQVVLSEAQVTAYVTKLRNTALENGRETQKEHLENLQRKTAAKVKSSTDKPVARIGRSCPRCGANMVERTNRRTGNAFWGCVEFPKCRGTRKAV
ncbi:nuclease-related domain-containing protein [Ruegeria arenilitoris]|uniref:nuclease-related domain-containing protein n=1 Tax=Ruegeria arenilitoris TaxID=1173585 RepID=UPI00147E7DC3|nr:NERD domain-containing protein [Ruegeria arenilitoris]